MHWIVRSSLRFRWLVVFAATGLTVFGALQIKDAPVDVFPEFAPPRVEIQTLATGNSSSQVEELITIPLEEQLTGIEGLDELRSKSVADLSAIELIFKRGTDQNRARQLVQERLAGITANLPTFAAPPFMMPQLSSTSRVMKIGMTSDSLNLIELSTIAYWKIRQRLLRVPGVANIAIWGEQLPQQHVQVDPKLLAKYGITLEQVMDTTADTLDSGLLQFSPGAVVGTGGFVETGGKRLNIRNVLPVDKASDLAAVAIERRNGRPLRLGDVATLVEHAQPLTGNAVINNGPGLMLVVQKFPGANTLELTRGVEDAMRKMEPGLKGITIDTTIFRPATFIESAIHNLTVALLLGCLLVILILVAFLFEFRTALISLLAIPLSLIAAVLVLDARETTINVMILAGLVVAVGVVVDDAIIGVENIMRRLRQNHAAGAPKSTSRVILDATLEVRSSITYATLIILVAVVPVFLLGGLSGSFFQPLVLAYMLAVLASMAVALTLTPALCLILLRNAPLHRRESPLLRVLKRGYAAVLTKVIRTPRPALAIAAACMLAGVLVYPTLGSSLLPNFKERDFLMHWLTKPGTSEPEETRISTRACVDLMKIPGVNNCGSHIGQAFAADEVYGVDFGENWISISDKVDYDKTLAAVQRTVDGYPGLYRDVQTYLRERVKEVLTGTSNSIVVRLFGPDQAVLRDKADLIAKDIAKIDGVVDAHADLQENLPHIEVEVDLVAARRYGLKPGDIRRQAATLIASEEVGDIFRGGRAYDVHVSSTAATRNSVTSMLELPIDTAGGGRVQLKDVADLRIAPTPNAVEREQASRRLDVGAEVAGRDLAAVVEDVQDLVSKIALPREYHAEVLGESTELNAAQGHLGAYGLIAAIVIFLLLQAVFSSFRLALLVFLTLPMALVGGVLAAKMTGGVLSLGSLVGFLTVFGICARNGILMISHFQHLERAEGMTFGPDLVLRGAKERLAPILMTATATGLAIVPLVAAGTIPGHEIEHPMAVVILGGLVTSTLLNLLVVPSLYLRFGRPKRRRQTLEIPTGARPAKVVATASLLLACLVLGACGDDDGTPRAQAGADTKASTATEKDFDPKQNFSASTRVDNEWHPLVPGTQFVFEGRSNRGLGRLPHRVIFTVTGLTKKIDGVDAIVLFDRDINRGKLLEAEITFFAQDDDGNVWNLGEYPEEYAEDGSFEGAPSTWLSGARGARAGILMRGDPRPGTPAYMQGVAPTIGFGDTAVVLRYEQRRCVPVGCYENVLVVDETNPLDPGDGHQLKLYAAGVGNISVAPGKGGKEREILELVKVRKLRPQSLQRLHEEALRLDRRAYRTVTKVWSGSERAKLR